jgi:hypothetical protein
VLLFKRGILTHGTTIVANVQILKLLRMNEEQNGTVNSAETNEATGKGSLATGSTLPSHPLSGNNNAQPQDDYYAVDYAKKEVISTIGDGEMHDEGLAGAGESTTDIQSSMERLTDEQDEAESHDSEQ